MQILFAWLYYVSALFFVLTVPHGVAEKYGKRAAFMTHWLIVYFTIVYYNVLIEIIWSR